MADPHNYQYIQDPILVVRVVWPHVKLYDKEKEIFRSVWENRETTVVAGNMLGKDFTAALVALVFFLTRRPCRVVTTSVDGTQLEAVLWGEIRKFIQEARFPLEAEKGGPLLVNHMHIRKVYTNGAKKGQVEPNSYLLGRVAAKGEGMLGHHVPKTGDRIPRTLAIADEASGNDDEAWKAFDTWADRKLAIGNPFPCENFFRRNEKEGDVWSKDKRHCYKKLIRIEATDSPNVKLALAQQDGGKEPTDEIIIPGVLSYGDYVVREETWDEVLKCVGLRARFWEGKDALLYPPQWLNRAADVARRLPKPGSRERSVGKAIGIDSAEGGDKTVWTVGDEYGILEQVAKPTPNTSDVPAMTILLAQKWEVPPSNWLFDRGGGGQQHADNLESMGYEGVQSVAFGGTVANEPRIGMTELGERLDIHRSRYVYVNRRAQLFYEARLILDPTGPGLAGMGGEAGYGIPPELVELRRQMAPIPFLQDREGRVRMLPKRKPKPESKEKSLIDLLGHSPDELDSFALMLHGIIHEPKVVEVGGAV